LWYLTNWLVGNDVQKLENLTPLLHPEALRKLTFILRKSIIIFNLLYHKYIYLISHNGGYEQLYILGYNTVWSVKGPIHDQSCCATFRVVQHDWPCMVLIDLIVNGQTCVAQNNFAQHDWSCMGRIKVNWCFGEIRRIHLQGYRTKQTRNLNKASSMLVPPKRLLTFNRLLYVILRKIETFTFIIIWDTYLTFIY
jgi:hypothetical protein